MDVTVLCDAVAVFPEAVEVALPGVGEEGWLLHFHSYLVVGESGVVLVDAGVGPAGGEAAEWLGVSGRLPGLLGQVGVGVEDVDAVVLTHVHLDHVGWVSDGLRVGFPRAEYVVQRDELEHVRGGTTYERRIRPVVEAGQLRVVDGTAIVRGARLMPTPGHTPGHQAVVTERAILGGDVFVHAAQARRPELTYVYERDPARAVTSRREVLALAAAMGVPIAAAHPPAALSPTGELVGSTDNADDVCRPYKL
ncbi:MBL fold metallo-hydrolase [Kribbella sp. GL6]|uniref:MBL fold metallo-hydrolase n=1 Tax=Kribbella sp. GL6 TaxID=3419765 RepID=UPI003D02EFF4